VTPKQVMQHTVAVLRSSRFGGRIFRRCCAVDGYGLLAFVRSAPAERLLVGGAELARLRESDGDDVAGAVWVRLSHLRPWMPWATEAAADPVAQRARRREAELHWDQGSDTAMCCAIPSPG
jgi:hypothetical protein